jgi:hypothetical protein
LWQVKSQYERANAHGNHTENTKEEELAKNGFLGFYINYQCQEKIYD